jgi:hypothetical protein
MNKYLHMPLALSALTLAATALMPAGARAQKPAQIKINSLIDQVPIPQSSSSCYGTCTTNTDASGVTTIIDNGKLFKHLQDELTAMSTADMNAMNNPTVPKSAPQAPTADQIAQMQADAMAKAQQYSQQGANPAAAMQAQAQANHKPSNNMAVMQGLGKAGAANMQIQSLLREMQQELSALNVRQVHARPNCPEVRQGSYVGPTCACTYDRSVAGEGDYVAARDELIQKQGAILTKYRGLLEVQVGIVDDLEAQAKYGDGITDPTTLQLLWSAQRQAITAMVELLAASNGVWTDGARTYLGLVNAKAVHC